MKYVPMLSAVICSVLMRLNGETVAQSLMVGLLAGILTAACFLLYQGENKKE